MEQSRESRIFEKEHEGICSNCGRKIMDDETVYVGYDYKGNHAAVCENCKNIVQTLILKRVHKDRQYKVPGPNTRLWKFMDLSKFLSLIQRSELYFRRADCFDDPYEGAKGIKKNEAFWDEAYKKFFIDAVKSTKEFTGKDVSDEEAQEQSLKLLSQLKEGGKSWMSNSFVCCWHANEFESEAMWNLYISDSKQGIAIQTTYNNLYLSLDKDPDIYTGYVNYIDFSKQFASINDTLFYKRYSFAHEREVRSVTYEFSDQDSSTGIYKPVNLAYLIENIYVSPTSQSWFYDVVKNIVEVYGLKKPVLQSTLNEEPFY